MKTLTQLYESVIDDSDKEFLKSELKHIDNQIDKLMKLSKISDKQQAYWDKLELDKNEIIELLKTK
ncbi:gp149 [Sphingomonas phage PAU]|uniref:gp149 n=1 Tax=Sphingomonas phage PAU TaxID=1150991 RepID=UPI00025732E1|nr:gp149 [Sphingomonas phage PAU]AFF28147.1 gp149 [Sphingomonas phage PAU]